MTNAPGFRLQLSPVSVMQQEAPNTFEQVRLWCITIDRRIKPPLRDALKRHDLDTAKEWMDHLERSIYLLSTTH